MSIRRVVGMTVVLGTWVAAWSAAPAAQPQTVTAKRPLVFALPGGNVECVVRRGPALPISALAFSPDGKTLAVGGYREVLLWDLKEAKLAKRVGAGQLDGMIHAVAFVDDGKALAVGDGVPHESGAVKLFDVATGELTTIFEEPTRVVYSLAVSPDGKLLAAGGADSLVHVWDLSERNLVKTIDGHDGWVLDVSFSADGKQLATTGADQALKVWEVGSWEPTMRFDLPATGHSVALSPNGRFVVAAVGGPKEWAVRVGRLDVGPKQKARRRSRTRAIPTGTAMPLDIVWPAQGNVFVACNDHAVHQYRPNGKLLRAFHGHTDWVYGAAATPSGLGLATGSADGTVKLWSAASGKLLATLVQLVPGTDDWLMITPQGHFATSSPEVIDWKTKDSSSTPKELTDRYHKPGRVRAALAGRNTPPRGPQRKAQQRPRPPRLKKAAKK